MGQDLAPALEKWTARDSVGTRGFTLTRETSDHEAKPFEVFLTPENVKFLSMLLSSRVFLTPENVKFLSMLLSSRGE